MVGDTVPKFLKLPGKDSLPQETRMGTQPAAAAATAPQGAQGRLGPDLGAEKLGLNGTNWVYSCFLPLTSYVS